MVLEQVIILVVFLSSYELPRCLFVTTLYMEPDRVNFSGSTNIVIMSYTYTANMYMISV